MELETMAFVISVPISMLNAEAPMLRFTNDSFMVSDKKNVKSV